MRDNFSNEIIKTLQYQSAFICSSPDCRKLTVAPSNESIDKFQYIGIAAHITAASPGGPRYDENMTPVERSSIKNAIFLCSGCASRVDKNEGVDYPASILRQWKEAHFKWVRSNLNQKVVKETGITNVLANFNQQGSQNFNYVTVNNYPENQKDENKEHDRMKFSEAENILSETRLLHILNSLIDRAACNIQDEELLEKFLNYLKNTGNGFIDTTVEEARDVLVESLAILLNSFSDFDKYPYSQTGDNYKIEFKPSLLHAYHANFPGHEENERWNQDFAVFEKKIQDVLDSYKAFRRSIKTALQI